MRIKDVMTSKVELAHPEMTLREAANKMREWNTGFLPVALGDRLVGTLTDRDIAIRSTAEGQNPNTARVAEAMSNGIVYCYEDQDVADAATLMGEKQIRRLPILSRDKRLVGVLSLGDAATCGADDRIVGEAVEQISHRSETARKVRQAGNGLGHAIQAAASRAGWLSMRGVREGLGEVLNGSAIGRHPVLGITGVLGVGALIAGGIAGRQSFFRQRHRWSWGR